ncbi:MAG: hypothetical protein AB1403_17575, partial [Candidatus Riflebacteria bacterium]
MLHRDGKSIRFLSQSFNIGRNTVRRILREHAANRAMPHEILPLKQARSSKLDAFKAQIAALLEKFPDIT